MESEDILNRMKKLMALGVIAGSSAVGHAEPAKPLTPPSTISTPATSPTSIKDLIGSIRGGTGSGTIDPTLAAGNPDFNNFENFDNWQDFDNFENFDNFSNSVGDMLEPGHGGGGRPLFPGTGGGRPVVDPAEVIRPGVLPTPIQPGLIRT